MESISVLQLNDHQIQELSRIERDSFAKLCRRINTNPIEHAKLVLENSQNNLRNLIDTYDDPALAENHRREVEDLLNATDFWTFKKLQKDREKQRIINQICDNAHTLPINFNYISNLCNKLNIVIPVSDNQTVLHSFLHSIPIVILSEIRYNAFIEDSTIIDGKIPCVCMLDHLTVTTDAFIDLVFSAAVSVMDGAAVPTEISKCREIGQDPSFQEQLKQCINMLLEKSDRFYFNSSKLLRFDPKMLNPFIFMSSGASCFTWYHEYMHLLMGHLETGSCYAIEFNADRFAWFLMDKHFERGSHLAFWSFLGSLVVILLFALIESIKDLPESKTHPSAGSRMLALLDLLGKNESEVMLEFLNTALEVCNPTLKRFWNLRLHLGD